jgi:hypothetical protein
MLQFFSGFLPKLYVGTVHYVSKLSLDSKWRSQVQFGNESKILRSFTSFRMTE